MFDFVLGFFNYFNGLVLCYYFGLKLPFFYLQECPFFMSNVILRLVPLLGQWDSLT